MDINSLKAGLQEPDKLITAIRNQWKSYFNLKAFQEINPEMHKVNDKAFRKDKIVNVPDPRGTFDAQGNIATTPTTVPVARIAIPMQDLIVKRSNAFLTGGQITFNARPANEKEQTTLDFFTRVWKRTKSDFKNAEIGRALLAETECAEIWYTRKTGEKTFEIKSNIYKPSDGYDLIPVFDDTRDMIAFGLGYKTKKDEQQIEHLDLYTQDTLYKFVKTTGTWGLAEGESTIKLVYGKIPVIYYSVKKSTWQDVQPMIERLELLMSNFADTNDYNGSPILFAEGSITGFSQKGESGKVIEGQEGAKLSYVSWDHAPESIKLEAEKLVDFIFTCTQTPDLSFKALVGLGTVSGVAFDRIMIDPHLKARDLHTGAYGEGIQRRCNFIVSAVTSLYPECEGGEDLDITPEFGLYKIDDQADKIEYLLLANGNKPLVDHKTSIALAGLSDDPDQTYTLIQEATVADAVLRNNGGQADSSIKEGSKVTVKAGAENDPSHKGVSFTVTSFSDNGKAVLTPAEGVEKNLKGSLSYAVDNLQAFSL